MKTIQQAINFVLVLLVFSQVISSLGIDLDEEMYETRDVSTAFRLLDFDTYYGSDSGLDERSGSLHLILNDEDLDDLEKDSPSTKVIIVTIHKYLTNSSLEIFAKEDSKVEGVVVLHGTDQEGSVDTAPDHFSPFSKIPQQFSGLHTSDETEWEWNPNSNLVFYTKWNFPIVYLSLEDESSEILKHAQENKEQDKTKYGISITGQMYGQYDSKVCLRRKYCDPIGGKSVYSFLGGQYNDSKPTTVVHCSIDSISMFPNYSPGYDSDSSSIAVLLAVFDALTDTAKTGAGMDWASTDRQIMFGFWEGEKWGHLGSKRFLKEVEEFKCTDYSSGKKSCETPYRYSLQFTEIDLNNIDESIELTQIGLPSTDLNAYHLYAHVERNDKEDESIELMQYIDDVSKNSSSESIQVTTISQASTSTPGIPPSSTESFIQQNSDIVSIVLSDFNEHFTNPYYGSVFDNGDLKNITQLVSVANLIARTIYAKALGITNLTTIPLELVVDESLLETLIDCLVTDNHCEFYENYFDSEYGEEYVTNYPGVYSEDTGRLQSIFIRNFLQTKTFPASFGSCESDSDCKEDEDGDDIYADCIKKKCYKRAAYYHQAYSQDIEYNTDTSKYDIDSKASNVWTESRWANLSCKSFLFADTTKDTLLFALGLAFIIIYYIIYFLFRKFSIKKFFNVKSLKQN
ncbi:nicastrin [Anaeramoeba flamelloides]|uniref:Nicastrin n=1 Tax=Anaeramoeba flamelloides TaxID=1746091 RepID=A0ABQ8YD70_9EUKA|nr:nicastrin [Anaeramoeba flamelloides]